MLGSGLRSSKTFSKLVLQVSLRGSAARAWALLPTLGRFLYGLGKVVVSERPLDLEHRMDLVVDNSLAVDVTVSSSSDPLARAEQQLVTTKSARYLALCSRQNLRLTTFFLTPTCVPGPVTEAAFKEWTRGTPAAQILAFRRSLAAAMGVAHGQEVRLSKLGPPSSAFTRTRGG